MVNQYIPIVLIFLFGSIIVGSMLFLAIFLGPKRLTKEKLEPFECGTKSVGLPRHRFSVKFYLVAMLFIIFDIEAIFLYPWAIMFRRLGLIGFIDMFIFIVVLLVGLIYAWKKGALEWE